MHARLRQSGRKKHVHINKNNDYMQLFIYLFFKLTFAENVYVYISMSNASLKQYNIKIKRCKMF